ncbi:ras-related and estrogen-regulated growth inhibitor-like protein isoform X4 [Mytilus edulis]|uniref:ras-related and estrogen-regulated growth inhibitor-like protein isoform X4 n=1 Tax=Mytilus edulis TaxID=6550 RepID=UPI0039F0E74C
MPFHKDPKPATEEKIQKHSHKDVNIVILGVQGVGKSALTVRYLTKRFIGDYETEHESLCSHVIMIDGKPLSIHILDTAWKDGACMKDEYLLWADGVILVYSMVDKSSFDKLREIMEWILAKKGEEKVIAVIGNKSDLIHRKQVSDTEATQFCAEYNCLSFDTSASDSYTDVSNAFNTIIREIKLNNKKREKLNKLMHNPSVLAKLQIRQSLKNLAEMKWRSRTSTM